LWLNFTAKRNDYSARFRNKQALEKMSEEIRVGNVTAVLSPDSLIVKGSAKRICGLLDGSLASLKDSIRLPTKKGNMWWSGVARFFLKQYGKRIDFLKLPDELKRKGSNGTCDFCARTGLRVSKARTSEHPFLVRTDKMSSFYSQFKGSLNICSSCAFASWFTIPRILFNSDWKENTLSAFFFDSPDLLRLARLQYSLGRLYAEQSYRNFKTELSYVKYPLENFVDFLLALHHQEINMRESVLQGVTVHVFSVRLDGRKVSFTRYYTVPNLPQILNFVALMKWQGAAGQHDAIKDVMRKFFFTYGGKHDTVIREELARRFLTSSEIADVMEEFLFRSILSENSRLSGFEVISYYKLTNIYEREVLGLNSHILNAARNLGDILGTVAAEKDDKSILYSLRGLRNLEDYYAYLHQFVTRHEDSIQKANIRPTFDTITGEINEGNWRNHKSIVGIYSVLKYVDILNQRQKTKKLSEVT